MIVTSLRKFLFASISQRPSNLLTIHLMRSFTIVRHLLLESFPHADVPTEFIGYQYYLCVVPTTYIAPRTPSLHIQIRIVSHDERQRNPHSGIPGIFFMFDVEPVHLTHPPHLPNPSSGASPPPICLFSPSYFRSTVVSVLSYLRASARRTS
jgi:hypothetical protein